MIKDFPNLKHKLVIIVILIDSGENGRVHDRVQDERMS